MLHDTADQQQTTTVPHYVYVRKTVVLLSMIFESLDFPYFSSMGPTSAPRDVPPRVSASIMAS